MRAAQTEDSWDRLAALAFGGAASAGGCSEHAHDYECTCAGEYGFGDVDEQAGSADLGDDGAQVGEASSEKPGDSRGVYADPETETAD